MTTITTERATTKARTTKTATKTATAKATKTVAKDATEKATGPAQPTSQPTADLTTAPAVEPTTVPAVEANVEAEAVLSEDEAREVAASLMMLPPADLVIEDNIRTAEKAPAWLVVSVKEHGVLVPVLAHPGKDGRIVIRDGQLRTLAAREAETPLVPAYVVPASDERRVRIIQQFIANEHRASLSDAERAEAWRQLTLEGMSVTAIAKATGAKRAEVKTGVAVAEKQIAKEAVSSYDLTLDQALVLATFEDEPDTLADLRRVAKERPGSFDHAAQRALDERERREKIAAACAEVEAKGWTVTDLPEYGNTKTARLHELETTTGERVTEENYAGLPGHAVAISAGWNGEVKVIHLVVDYKTHGLRKIGSTTNGNNSGAWTEEKKAERRTVIANNKAWDSAQKVRRTWLVNFLARKRLPADALAYAATVLAGTPGPVGKAVDNGHPLACDLLGVTKEPGHGKPNPLAALVENTPAKAGHVALALALGAIENSTGKHTWRNPGQTDARYLRQLASWGYVLSDVEQIVANAHTPKAAKASGSATATGAKETAKATVKATAEKGSADNPATTPPSAATPKPKAEIKAGTKVSRVTRKTAPKAPATATRKASTQRASAQPTDKRTETNAPAKTATKTTGARTRRQPTKTATASPAKPKAA